MSVGIWEVKDVKGYSTHCSSFFGLSLHGISISWILSIAFLHDIFCYSVAFFCAHGAHLTAFAMNTMLAWPLDMRYPHRLSSQFRLPEGLFMSENHKQPLFLPWHISFSIWLIFDIYGQRSVAEKNRFDDRSRLSIDPQTAKVVCM